MLSLVVVLSVYYVTTPDKMNTASPATGEKIGQEKQGTDKAVTNEAPKETPKKKIQARKQQIKKQTKRKMQKETSKKRAMYQFNQVMRISQLYVCKWKISVVNKSKITRSDEFNKSFSNRKE